LIPASIARRIHAAVLQPAGPLILAPEDALTEIFAQDTGYGFHLYLGDPNTEPDYPTLSEFIETRG
jgi:hypothetical protein